MKSTTAKRVFSTVLAASLAFSGAAAFAPEASIAYAGETAASTIAKVSNVKYDILVYGGVDCIKFTWDKVEGANHYTYRYNTKYDSSNPSVNEYTEDEGDDDSASVIIPVGDDYGDVWFQVAAMKDSDKGEYSDGVWASKDTVAGNLELVRQEADFALLAKAKSLAKKYKKDGYDELTYCLCDIDGSGNNLLFFSYNGNRSGVTVFAYDGEKMKVVRALKEIGGVKGITAKNGTVYYVVLDSADTGAILSYTFDAASNKFVSASKVTIDYSTKTFRKDGRKMTKKAFNKYLKKIAKYTEVEYYKTKL